MKITLTQTGGLMGRTKTATAEWPGDAAEFKALAKKIGAGKASASKDGYAYFIKADDDKDLPVLITNIDDKYSALFDELFQNLKITD